MQKNNQILPFLRWAGGKRWLSRKIAPILRQRLQGRYFEPFLGAGAMFFAIAPKRALLSDINTDLINGFQIVKERADELVNAIRKMSVDKDTYYRIRSSRPRTTFNRAVRFIYLNRTCYGGLYRENLKGEFNTPYGGGSRTPAPLWDRNLIANASKLLSMKSIKLKIDDFAVSMKKAGKGDVIYCDPTYRAVTRSQFDRYGSIIFDWNDQERLAEEALQALDRGVLVIISNTYCSEIRELYDSSILMPMKKNKTIGNISKRQNNNKEYLIILDPEKTYEDWHKISPVELSN
jgi:DNA adenine methylase